MARPTKSFELLSVIVFITLAPSTPWAEDLVESSPLSKSPGPDGVETLFETVDPAQSGVEFTTPVIVDHPLARAYH
ncbi:MAG: hypothetical protein AAF226_09480, partial [Verrucomicrobiota bacterium]